MNIRHLAITLGMLLLVSATAVADYNATVDVHADPLNNFAHEQGQGYDIDEYFPADKPPDANRPDLIQVLDAKGRGAGVYGDPVDDGALLTITQETGPVKVDVDRRQGIGALYWVEVSPAGGGGTGGGGGPTILWADVQDLKLPGALVLRDKLTQQTVNDRTNENTDAPMLYCPVASDGKGDVEFWLITEQGENGTYEWSISQSSTVVASGYLNQDNSYTSSKDDLAVGLYTIDIAKQGDANFHRKIGFAVFQVTMGRILKGTTEQTAALEISEDYAFEYTLAPANITLPSLTFRIAHTINAETDTYVAVHKADLTNVTSGLHTETWTKTQWTVTDQGAYANPKNGTYGAFCVYTVDGKEYKVSGNKDFTTQLVFRFTVQDEMVTYKTLAGADAQHASGLRDPQESDFRVRCDFQDGTGTQIILNSTFEYGTVTQANLDGDAGNEIAEVQIIQKVSKQVDAGDYKVTVMNLKDQAGNTGPDPDKDPTSVLEDWPIRLR